MADDEVIETSHLPGLVIAIGNVFSVDETRHSFTMNPMQFIAGPGQNESISLLMIQDKDFQWPARPFQLPTIGSLVSVVGTLQNVERQSRSRMQNRSITATILVTRLSHLTRSNDPPLPKKTSSVPATIQSGDVQALTNRVRGYNASASQERNRSLPGVDSSSAKLKAKRKASAIDQEVEETVPDEDRHATRSKKKT